MAATGISCQTGGPTFYYSYITSISGSGFTAVGPGAQANNFHQPPAREDVHSHGHSPRHGIPRDNEQQEPTYNGTYMYDRAKPGRKSFSSENNSGTYCLPSINEAYYQQQFGPKWNPKPSKGILAQQGATDAHSSIESFLKDLEKSMGEFDNADGPLKEEKEQFILLQILPYLEVSWGKSPTKKMDAYRILAKISSSRSGGEVVKHALLQLQYLLFRDNLESCEGNNLLKVEKIIRSTINSPDAVFKEEADSVREIRLSVYQRVLCLIIVHQIQAGFSTVDFNNDLKKLREELKVCCNQINYKRKNYFRYCIEFIEEAISYLLKPNNKVAASKLGDCLDQCQDIFVKQDFNVMDLTFLRKLKRSRAFVKKVKSGEWFDLHCIMCYLHGKVHSECPKRQMCTERRAMILLRRILEAYQEEGGGDDWRFCLLAASILSDVAMNNVTRELRIEAASCLINLLKDKKLRRRPECRVILERMSSEVVFSPDPLTKELFANHLFENNDLSDALPEQLHIQRLTTRYRNQTLEVNKTAISQGQRCFVKRGMFQRKEVVVKILHITKQDILEGESQDQSETRDRLVREAYNLSRLRVQKHPHITVLLAYNTKSFPYHIITEFERYGNLLQFVQASREGNELLPTPLLLKVLLDIIEALMLLQNQGLVHRDVRAENVLVGDNYVCKLTGMQSLRQLQTESIHAEVQDQDSLYDYCSADDSCLDVISPDDENLPVRWKAPECLLEHRYSTASDVWAFGVLMYEVLTYGSHPYRNIPIDDEVISHTPYFQPDNGADDLPKRNLGQDDPLVKERITGADTQHLKKLLTLNHPNLVKIWQIDNLESPCPVVEMVRVARLARSKSLPKSADDVTSTSCAIQRSMPSDSTRWSSPEVILENNYSHASDLWAFGILTWELYSAFATGQERKGYSLPYCDLAIDQLLKHRSLKYAFKQNSMVEKLSENQFTNMSDDTVSISIIICGIQLKIHSSLQGKNSNFEFEAQLY